MLSWFGCGCAINSQQYGSKRGLGGDAKIWSRWWHVVDVALTTVKIQNWDKTITTIPAHALVSDAFKNWRGMSESRGRRIKKVFHLDLSGVRFLKESEVRELEKIDLLKEYFAGKRADIGETE